MVTTREGGLYFILSDSGNYDFDVEVECCGLVGFLKAVIECGCLGCWYGKAISIFVLELRRKRKAHVILTFILQYSSNVVFLLLITWTKWL